MIILYQLLILIVSMYEKMKNKLKSIVEGKSLKWKFLFGFNLLLLISGVLYILSGVVASSIGQIAVGIFNSTLGGYVLTQLVDTELTQSVQQYGDYILSLNFIAGATVFALTYIPVLVILSGVFIYYEYQNSGGNGRDGNGRDGNSRDSFDVDEFKVN